MKRSLIFLGTGASMGVPVIGCECQVCQSTSHFNKRFRPSVLIKIDNKQLLIDAGPDFRLQALRAKIKSLDGILVTHSHHDHTAGIDELRAISYKNQQSLPILMSGETAEELKRRYNYIFDEPVPHKLTTRLNLHILPTTEGEYELLGIKIGYVTYYQGEMSVSGFRLGNVAYLSDIQKFSSSIFEQLKGVEILIVSALRYQTSPLHFSVDEAVDFINQVGAKQAWLTHISHDLDYEKTNAYLPNHIKLAYDGLEIEFGGSNYERRSN